VSLCSGIGDLLNFCFRRSFEARRAQSRRSYEYYVPVSMLKRLPDESLLEKFTGRKSFHNFTRRKQELEVPVNLPGKLFWSSVFSSLRTEDHLSQLDTLQLEALKYKTQAYYHRNLFSLTGSIRNYNNIDFYVVELIGESFLYHQIRKIVGTIIAICNDHVSEQIIEDAMKYPFKMHLPIAPARPLSLVYTPSSFYNSREEKDDLQTFSDDDTARLVEQYLEDVVRPHICCSELVEEFKEWESTILVSHLEKITSYGPMWTKYMQDIEEVSKNSNVGAERKVALLERWLRSQ
jgi:hypothetical protein